MTYRLTIHPKSSFILTSSALTTCILTIVSFFSLSRFDEPISQYFQQFHHSQLINNLMLFITNLANWKTITFAFCLLTISLVLMRHWYYLISFFCSITIGQLIVIFIKYITARPRPAYAQALVYEPTFSFPSGHTFLAFSFYGLLAYYFFRTQKNLITKSLTIFISIALILSIGFSRIYLGAHWPTDVIASLITGCFWVATLIVFNEIHRQHHHHFDKPIINRHYINIISLWFCFLFEAYTFISFYVLL